MRYVGLALALTLGTQAAAAQLAYDLPIRNAPVKTIAEFPGVRISQVRPSSIPNRLYYRVRDTLFVFDVGTKKSLRVAEGGMGNLDISPKNDRLVFNRRVEGGNVSNVWMMPLDPKTGLATGPARRLALTPGDQPRVSPDGKWVAFAAYDSSDFSASQHLTIIGADGGTERVVARVTEGIGRIQWAPDGRTIYFISQHRPKPGWSGRSSALRLLLRVPAAGGPVDTMRAEFKGLTPGLSPDGRFLALAEEGSVANYVIADTRGVPVGRFSVPTPGQAGWAWEPFWSDARTLVGIGEYHKDGMFVADLSTGASRELVPSAFQPETPSWSPDGKSVAAFATSRGRRVLLVVDATSGKRREYTSGVVQPCCMYDRSLSIRWSPDGKAVAFHGAYREPLRVIELATGAMREVSPKAMLIGEYRWRSDSRALQYTATASARDAYRTIHETTLDGSDRVIFDRLPNDIGAAGMRTDSTAIFNSDSGVFLVSIRTRATTRLRPYVSPWIESNRQGTTFATQDFPSDPQQVSIVGANGTQTTLKFPFFRSNSPPYHQAPLAFFPDGRLLVIGSAAGQPQAAYAVDPTGREPRKLFDLRYPLDHTYIDLSPDGRYLAYNIGPIASTIAQVDLTSFLPATPSSKR